MLVKLAEAIGRLVMSGREMSRLAGFTARVTQLRQVLMDLNQGHYVRSMVSANGVGEQAGRGQERVFSQTSYLFFVFSLCWDPQRIKIPWIYNFIVSKIGFKKT